LANTPASPALRDSVWMYPIVTSVHVLSLCLFVGFAVCVDFRLLGLIMRRTPVSEVAERLLPWRFVGFALIMTSGALLFYSDPVKFYYNISFRVKTLMLILAGLNAGIFRWTVYRNVNDWNLAPVTPRRARVAGGLSLLLWGCVVVAGQMSAYK
jgi:hypothetical protein